VPGGDCLRRHMYCSDTTVANPMRLPSWLNLVQWSNAGRLGSTSEAANEAGIDHVDTV